MNGDAELLIATVLPLVAAALVMVLAMVRWTEGLVAPAPGPRHRTWGFVYVGAWAVIVALAVRLVGQSDGGWTPTSAALLVLCAGGYWALHWFFVWAARAIARSQARAAAAERAAGWSEASEPEEPAAPAAEADAPVEAPSPIPAPAPASRLGAIGRVLRPVGMVVGALLVIGIGEALPALRALEAALARHRAAWVAATLGPAILGWVLLMAGAIRLALTRGERMSPRQVAQMQASLRRTRGAAGRMAHRVLGKAIGVQGADEASFSEVKAAWRARAWRYSPRWRWLFAMMLGGMLMLVGGFGAVVVLTPPGIKLLFGGALAYALVQITRGFARA
jgi:hypothetical protein